jgi:hypothetical protein
MSPSQPSRAKGGRGNSNHNRAPNNNPNKGNNNNSRNSQNTNDKRVRTPDAASDPHAAPATTPDNSNKLIPIHTPNNKVSSPNVRQAQVASDEPYFAGHTFGQSPAASALPIPAFCVKSSRGSPPAPQSPTPDVVVQDQDAQDSTNTSSESDGDTPLLSDAEARESDSASPATTTPARSDALRLAECEASPLDLFFNAQRREKERAAAAQEGAAPGGVPAPSAFSPVQPGVQTDSPTYQRKARPTRQTPASSAPRYAGISTQELDGTPGMAMGPAFSTPFGQRISRARPDFTPAQTTSTGTPPASAAPVDRSDDIKKLLFGNPTKPSSLGAQGLGSQGLGVAVQSPPSRPNAATTPERSHWQSIYGSQASRSPEIVSLEHQLLTILKVTPARGQMTT